MSYQRPKIFVAIPKSRSINPYTASSAMYNANQLGLAGVEIVQPRFYDEKPLSRARNNSVKEFRENDAFADCTHYCCLDDDQILYSETLLKLLGVDKPIVSAWYLARLGNIVPIVFGRLPDKQILNINDFKNYYPLSIKELIARKLPDLPLAQVDGIGLGCCLMKREAVEKVHDHAKKLQLPMFLEWSPYMGSEDKFFGEDLWFSEMCKAAEVPIYVHLGAYIGHWAEQGFVVGLNHLKARAMQEGIIDFDLNEVS